MPIQLMTLCRYIIGVYPSTPAMFYRIENPVKSYSSNNCFIHNNTSNVQRMLVDTLIEENMTVSDIALGACELHLYHSPFSHVHFTQVMACIHMLIFIG